MANYGTTLKTSWHTNNEDSGAWTTL